MLNYRSSSLEHGRSPSELTATHSLALPRLNCRGLSSRGEGPTTCSSEVFTTCPIGGVVRLRDHEGWATKIKVLKKVTLRSYFVGTNGGHKLQSNRRHFLATPELYAFNPPRVDYDTSLGNPLQARGDQQDTSLRSHSTVLRVTQDAQQVASWRFGAGMAPIRTSARAHLNHL